MARFSNRSSKYRPRQGNSPQPGRFRERAEAPEPNFRYVLFNKPYGVLTRFTDTNGRPTLADFIDIPGIYPVGRLDFDSEGLLLLTDDGRLAHRLTDPKFDHSKTYLAQVEHVPAEQDLEMLRKGITLSDGPCKSADVDLLIDPPDLWERPVPIRFRKNVPTSWLRIVIREGRNRQVRRMTAAIGHPCLRLVRVAIGKFDLGRLSTGEWSEVSPSDI
jgi:23S rRNA pseudouridine2457 synthase